MTNEHAKGVEYAPGDLGERQDPHRRMGSDPDLIARVRAALKLISPEHITPMGVRVIEKILAAAEGKL